MGVASFAEAYATFLAEVRIWNERLPVIDVLEVGCGSMTRVKFPGTMRVTVIDRSLNALNAEPDAVTKVHGDLATAELGFERYDAAIAGGIIEYLQRPLTVLDKLLAALRPGGLLIIASANPHSLQGVINRYIPRCVHVFLHRHFLHTPHAGEPGYPPYSNRHNPHISPTGLTGWASGRQVEVMYLQAYENDRRAAIRTHSRAAGLLVDMIVALGNRLTSRPLEESDFLVILRKKELPARHA